MIVTTSICANYLPKAMVLAKSLKETNPNTQFIVCLLEREIHPAARSCEHFDNVVLAKDLGFEHFDKFIFKHSIVEASTAVKGQLFRYLFRDYAAEDHFVYLDPDIKVYGELTELVEAMNRHPIVLTPHLCHPEDIMDAVMDNELSALQHGVFNLGFLALSRSEEAMRFADWWASRLAMFCYDDIPRGIFTDQKWIDLAPCYFDVHILKHPGYNVAPWNLSKRRLTADDGPWVNGQPLRFFHYSGFDSGANEGMINKYVPDRSNVVYALRDEYVRELNQVDQARLGHTKWSYDYYASGERIERDARFIYRDTPEIPYRVDNPFALSNEYFERYISVEQIAGNVIRQGKKLLKRLMNH
ncbi:glycosyltransferase [Paenibacillus periandrae]|uniref:glycosyltransferase n=1 Tax=Paenibacillus periandrae TaxID=1761741 RepID=UPI001F08E0B8|nr:glycosyltransferase [Paenibacillus periandrae]